MIRKICAGAAVIVLAAAVGIGVWQHGQKEQTKEETWYCSVFFGGESYSDSGRFRCSEHTVLYQDAASGEESVICNKAGCTHEDDSCPAYFENTPAGMITRQDKLNYIDNLDCEMKGLNLWEADLNGENRKKTAYFEGLQQADAVCYTSDAVLIGYSNDMDLEKLEQKDYYEAGVYLYDRNTRKGKTLYADSSWGNRITSISVYGDDVYFLREYTPLPEDGSWEDLENNMEKTTIQLYRIALDGGKEEKLDEDLASAVFSVQKSGDNILYVKSDGLYGYSMQNGSIEQLMKEKDIALGNTFLNDETVFFSQGDGDGKVYRYYRYQDGEISEMGTSKENVYVIFDQNLYEWNTDSSGGMTTPVSTDQWISQHIKPEETEGKEQ